MRWMVLALGLLAALPAGAADLDALTAESDRYPQDYAAAVRLARAAAATGAHETALLGWDRATTASGGNLETVLGRAMALLGLGRGAEARAATAEAVVLEPRSPIAWVTRAWSLRQAQGVAPPSFYLLPAEAAYARALRLDPTHRDAACGLPWTRLELGDRVGARVAFGRMVERDLGDTCALDGGAAAGPRIRFGGAAALSGTVYAGASRYDGGLGFLGTGWGTVDDLVTFRVGSRAATSFGSTPYQQQELWGGVGVSHRGFGAELLVGGIGSNDSADRRLVLGGRAWATVGATFLAEASRGLYRDGDASNVGGSVAVPITTFATARVGGNATWFAPHEGGFFGPPPLFVEPSLRVGATFSSPGERGVDVTVLGRLGTEWRPLKFDEPAIWNTTSPVFGGLDLDVALRLFPGGGVLLGYEVMETRAGPDPTLQAAGLPSPTGPVHSHVFTVGLFTVGEGELP